MEKTRPNVASRGALVFPMLRRCGSGYSSCCCCIVRMQPQPRCYNFADTILVRCALWTLSLSALCVCVFVWCGQANVDTPAQIARLTGHRCALSCAMRKRARASIRSQACGSFARAKIVSSRSCTSCCCRSLRDHGPCQSVCCLMLGSCIGRDLHHAHKRMQRNAAKHNAERTWASGVLLAWELIFVLCDIM